MADYIYTLESRLTPDQMRGVTLIQDLSRTAGLNVYLTGGAVRDILTGFPIRDLDFTLQGNPLKLQKELEKAGAVIHGVDDHTNTLYLNLPGNVRAEISMSRSEQHVKTGKPPVITPATITEDLRRRDFTINAMALSLNEGSKGLLQDPFNGVADLEAKLIRILQNYSFLEDPSRLIRATRFATRFGWPLEERTQQRFEAAKEGKYIEHVSARALGYEVEQLAYEDDPLHIVKTLEKEGWLSVLHPHWTTAKIDVSSLAALMKTRQQMTELGYWTDPSPAVLHFLTSKLNEKDRHEVEKSIPRKGLVEGWRDLEKASIALLLDMTATRKVSANFTELEQVTLNFVLNAQQALVNARVALVTAQHDRVVASYSVLNTVGRLSPIVLNLNTNVYDPSVHYHQVRDSWVGVRTPDGR
jgi:hypothetical protein